MTDNEKLEAVLTELDKVYSLTSEYISFIKDNIVLTSIIWRFGYGISLLVGPTSFVLLSGLTYLDMFKHNIEVII